MYDRMQTFTTEELDQIHSATVDILENVGVNFNDHDVAGIFSKNGFKTSGTTVFIKEKDIAKALEGIPHHFKIHSLNNGKTVEIGEDDVVFLPTGGAPNVAAAGGRRRAATLEDYHSCCKLVQTSKQLDMNGLAMVQPADCPGETAHLDMLLANHTMCDKPFVAASNSNEAAMDSIEMAGIMGNGKANILEKPVMASIINPASPLQYASEQASALVTFSEYRQPIVICAMVLSGSTGPISIPGLLALANAEILSGIVLTQLVSCGTPVVYGSTSAPMDMKAATAAVGAPETTLIASATVQLAKTYNLPCRTGGMLTDAHCPDSQASAEATLLMTTAMRNGANFIFHACGQLGSFLSMSYEKWLIDEEICSLIRKVMSRIEVNKETINMEMIKEVGSGGAYLTHPNTFENYKTLSRPILFNRHDYEMWQKRGAKTVLQVASEELPKRLASYKKPRIDEGCEKELIEYVKKRKKEILK